VSTSSSLPHRFPFQLVDRRVGEKVVLALSAGAVWGRGETPYPGPLVIEMLAQAAILLLQDAAAGTQALLAGVEEFDLREPPRPGQKLVATVELLARFGGTFKVGGRLETEGRELATAALLLVVEP